MTPHLWNDIWPTLAGAATGTVLALGAITLATHNTRPKLTREQRKHSHLGWRFWNWNGDVLCSPVFTGQWHDGELYADKWEPGPFGSHGIYAAHYRADWMTAQAIAEHPAYHRSHGDVSEWVVFGVVERFGKFVVGEKGWRAEHAVIRELMCKTDRMAAHLRKAYPDPQIKIGVNPIAFVGTPSSQPVIIIGGTSYYVDPNGGLTPNKP